MEYEQLIELIRAPELLVFQNAGVRTSSNFLQSSPTS